MSSNTLSLDERYRIILDKLSCRFCSFLNKIIFVGDVKDIAVDIPLYKFYFKILSIFLSSIVLSSGLLYILSLYLDISYMAVVLVIGIFIFPILVSNLYIYSKESELVAGLRDEYPIIVLIFAIFSHLNLYSIFREVTTYLGWFLRYSRVVVNRILGMYFLSRDSLSNTVYRCLNIVPHEDLRDFLLNYLRVSSISGDLRNFLSNHLDRVIDDIRVNWENTWRNAVGRLETIILIFGLTPAIIMSVITIAGVSMVISTFIFLIVSLPLIAFIIYVFLDSEIVKIPLFSLSPVDQRVYIMSTSASLCFYSIMVFLFGFGPLSLELYLYTLIVFFLYPSFYSVYIWFRRMRNDSDTSMMLMGIEEIMRNGFSLTDAFRKIDAKRFSSDIRNGIYRVRHYLEYRDINAYNFRIRTLSPVSILTFVILLEIIKSGGGLKEVIFLRELVEEYVKMYSRRFRYAFIPLLTGVFVILAGTYSFYSLKMIMGGLAEYGGIVGVAIISNLSLLSILFKLVLILNIFISGILISKVIHDDIQYTYPNLILLISFILSLYTFPI
jgi:hypothetical protein